MMHEKEPDKRVFRVITLDDARRFIAAARARRAARHERIKLPVAVTESSQSRDQPSAK